MPEYTVLIGDALTQLKSLPDESVQCVCTSVPYYGLRSYLEDGHNDKHLEVGAEDTPAAYIARLVEVFREVRRVLRKDGTLWLNIGDSYNAAGRTGHGTRVGAKQGTNRASAEGVDTCRSSDATLKPKDLLMIPSRLAIALCDDGWYLRSMMPWIKANCMPESVQDRPTSAVEYVFLLTKSAKYFYDAEAVKMPVASSSVERLSQDVENQAGTVRANGGSRADRPLRAAGSLETRSLRNSDFFFDTWQGLVEDDGEPLALVVNPQPYKGAHFAVWPPRLVEPMIKAGTSEHGACADCGAPYRRILQKEKGENASYAGSSFQKGKTKEAREHLSAVGEQERTAHVTTVGWEKTCKCATEERRPCLVLDPFVGSGTTLLVANRLCRDAVGIDLNENNQKLIAERMQQGFLDLL